MVVLALHLHWLSIPPLCTSSLHCLSIDIIIGVCICISKYPSVCLPVCLSIYLSIYLDICASILRFICNSIYLLTSLHIFIFYFFRLTHTSNVRRLDKLLCLWISAVGDLSHICFEVRFHSRIWFVPNTHILTTRYSLYSTFFLFIIFYQNVAFFFVVLIYKTVHLYIDHNMPSIHF